ncbi:hypothetical protein Tco_0613765, partial [Tanacetum coccineum]
MRIEESLNITFDESLPEPKSSSSVEDDRINEPIVQNLNGSPSLQVNILDEGYPKSLKEARGHPIEQLIGKLNERTLREKESKALKLIKASNHGRRKVKHALKRKQKSHSIHGAITGFDRDEKQIETWRLPELLPQLLNDSKTIEEERIKCKQAANLEIQKEESFKKKDMSIEEIISEKRLIDDEIKDITNELSYKRFRGEKIDDEYERDCEIKIKQLLQDYSGLDIEMRKKERVRISRKRTKIKTKPDKTEHENGMSTRKRVQ